MKWIYPSPSGSVSARSVMNVNVCAAVKSAKDSVPTHKASNKDEDPRGRYSLHRSSPSPYYSHYA